MTHPLLLTEDEAADRLRLSARTLRKARQEGTLRYVLIGRAVRYTLEDLESFIDSLRRVQPPCQPHRSSPRVTTRRPKSAQIVPFTGRRRAT